MKDLTRVFVVSDVRELSRPLLREQVNLDINSDVKVYFVMESDISKVTDHPDFGVWDYEYLCTVDPSSNEATLSSRKHDIEMGRNWEEEILKVAVRIQNIERDIDSFIKSHSSLQSSKN